MDRFVTGFCKKQSDSEKRTMLLENFIRFSDALRVLLLFFLYDQMNKMSEVERIYYILKGRSDNQKEHMLQEMATGMDKL